MCKETAEKTMARNAIWKPLLSKFDENARRLWVPITHFYLDHKTFHWMVKPALNLTWCQYALWTKINKWLPPELGESGLFKR